MICLKLKNVKYIEYYNKNNMIKSMFIFQKYNKSENNVRHEKS